MAMQETKEIFGDELEEAPDFYNGLKESLERAPVIPKQIELRLVDVNGEELERPIENPKPPRKPYPKSPVPIVEQFRVEVWRETKNSKKNVKVSKL